MRCDEHELLNMLPRLRRYARALVRHKEEADDLVQDTLERAWLKSSLWRGVSDMRAWLFSIMHNLHADGVRRPRIHTVELDDNTPEIPIAARQGEQLAMRDLQAALNQLPDEQREILLLVALEEMAYADIATTLNIPMSTVMSRLSRGRERLRIVLETQAEPVRLKIVK
ncbi:RNA polymerase sigma factor [Janthinobacterium sp. B9-8]|uniref:RNA polymerase sigma factor n=1 Tax=Janthinobacterium sp. B9-8 TaxID=1236179 RepID=UPI00061CE439|nr:sigma-70 family RNA polymerase sigma factor [Janthinobacterium sp. B9-8]AMC33921.1 RNA polymerase subunit sigma-24 [Janthinobacterium sp. B9-8]